MNTITLAEIRERKPQYAEMSDAEIIGRFKTKNPKYEVIIEEPKLIEPQGNKPKEKKSLKPIEYKDVPLMAALTSFVNSALLNAPKKIVGEGGRAEMEKLKKANPKASTIGDIAGYGVGAPAKIIKGAVLGAGKILPKVGKLAKLGKETISGALGFGGTEAAKTGIETGDIKQAAIAGGKGAVAGGIGGVATGGVVPIVSKALQTSGKKTMEKIFLPSVKKQNLEKFDVQKVFDYAIDSPVPFKGGVKGMEKRITGLRAKINDEFSNAIALSGNKKVNAVEVLKKVVTKNKNEYLKTGKGANIQPEVESAFAFWEARIKELSNKQGNISVKTAQGLKQSVGEEAYIHPELKKTYETTGKERAARELERGVGKAISEKIPETIPLNKALSETKPLQLSLKEMSRKETKKPGLDLYGLMSLMGFLGAAGGGYGAGAAGAGIGAGTGIAAGYGLKKLSQSPTYASQKYRLGELLEKLNLENLYRR